MIVAIVGAESTGKTRLAQALAEQLQAPFIGEYLREWCDREGRTPRHDEQAAIAAEQARRIEQAAASAPLVIADTTPLMTAVYSQLLFGDVSLYPVAEAWHRRQAGATLLTALDLPWEADGLQRDGPHVRAPVDALLRAALQRIERPFSVVYGHGPARLDAALRALRRALAPPLLAPPAGTGPATRSTAPAAAKRAAAVLATTLPAAALHETRLPAATLPTAALTAPQVAPPNLENADTQAARWRPFCSECLDPACERHVLQR